MKKKKIKTHEHIMNFREKKWIFLCLPIACGNKWYNVLKLNYLYPQEGMFFPSTPNWFELLQNQKIDLDIENLCNSVHVHIMFSGSSDSSIKLFLINLLIYSPTQMMHFIANNSIIVRNMFRCMPKKRRSSFWMRSVPNWNK